MRARLTQPTTLSLVERLVTLEERDRSDDGRFVSIDNRLKIIEEQLATLVSVLTQAKGIRWLLVCIGGIAGTTAITVTATIAVIRYLTGH